MDKKLHRKLEERKEKGTLRSLSSFEGMIDFVSNDYLGLSNVNFELPESSGATGSRLISGNTLEIMRSEEELARFFESPAALCFNSGYDANMGIFGTIPQRGDVVLYDANIHASVRDGIRLSYADSFSFLHNDLKSLKRLLKKNSHRTTYVAIEGLYSMDGDIAPVGKIARLAEEFGAYLIIDEAHSGGVFGKDGRGVTHAMDAVKSSFIRLITFGKAYGGHGAVVLCSGDVREYLINFARSFIYTTALPQSVYLRMVKVVGYPELQKRRTDLQQNIEWFRSHVDANFLHSDVNSPIQIIRGPEIDQLKELQDLASQKEIAFKLIYPPTVSKGKEGARICIHSFNTKDELRKLVSLLCACGLGKKI